MFLLRVLTPVIALLCGAAPVLGSFHLWQIREVFSSADGSVQFIEMFTTFSGQQFLAAHTIKTTSALNTFTFPSNTGTPTTNKRLLLATAGFGSLAGGVTPDFTIPSNFFNPASDTLNFENFSVVTFTALPTGGVTALQISSTGVQSTATNSPTNFAGAAGSVNVPPPLFGDYSNNGVVDAADYTLYRDNLGLSVTLSNDTTPGTVTAADYTVWRANFSGIAASASVVPEASSCAILVLTLLSLSRIAARSALK